MKDCVELGNAYYQVKKNKESSAGGLTTELRSEIRGKVNDASRLESGLE